MDVLKWILDSNLAAALIGALGAVLGVWAASHLEMKSSARRWEQQRQVEDQREFERRLAEVLVHFDRWSITAGEVAERILDPSKRTTTDPGEATQEADKEIGRMLVELEVASTDEETLDLVQDAQQARRELAERAEEVATGGDEEAQRFLLCLQGYRGTIADLRLLNVRRKMPDRPI